MREINIYRRAMNVAWPAIVESCFASIVGIIDSMMVGTIGTYAVAAVGLCNQPKLMAFSFFFALNTAVSALVARRKGENEREAVHSIVFTAMILSVSVGILVGSMCFWQAGRIMTLCGSTEEMYQPAVHYFRIIMCGILFQVLSLSVSAALRGVGSTQIVMKVNILSQSINLLGNYLLIGGNFGFPALGVAGAAIATVFSSVVSLLLSLAYMTGKNSYIQLDVLLRSGRRGFRSVIGNIGKLGLPSLAEQILMRIGFLFTAVMAAGFGSNAFAANHAGMNLFSLTYAFGEGMQIAAVTLVGQSLGERDSGKARQYMKVFLRSGILISLVLAVLYIAGAVPYMMLYFKDDGIIRLGRQMMYFIAVIVFIQMEQQIITGCLKGAGDVFYVTCTTVISVTVIRPMVTYLLCYTVGLGIMGCWYGILTDQVCRLLFTAWRYRKGTWTGIHI